MTVSTAPSSLCSRTRAALTRVVLPGWAGVAAVAFAISWLVHPAGAATPVVTISPVSGSGGSLVSGEVVKVSVGANALFTPNTRVNILECADPGGKTANLPTSVDSCDGLTIQSDTVSVNADGSVAEPSYTLYALPDATFENPNGAPVTCNQSADCVLYVGENQEDFSQPKLFSAPFALAGGSTPAGASGSGSSGAAGGGTGATAPSSTTATTSSTGSAASSGEGGSPVASGVSLVPTSSAGTTGTGQLAFTGPLMLPWLTGVGGGLVVVGAGGRRVLRGATS